MKEGIASVLGFPVFALTIAALININGLIANVRALVGACQ